MSSVTIRNNPERERYVADQVRIALAAGARQVLVLDAGLDTLGARLSEEHPSVPFLEVDHPATQEIKHRALARLGGERPNLHLVPLDPARARLEETLSSHPAFDRNVRTMVVAGGLLMYLGEADVEILFAFLREHLPARSRFVFSFIETRADGSPRLGRRGWMVRTKLRLVGEPFRWGIARERLEGYLEQRAFRLLEQPTSRTLCSRYVEHRPGDEEIELDPFEHLAVAELTSGAT